MSHKDFINKLVYERIIQQYLFITSLQDRFSDEYIKTMYRINPKTIRFQYSAIPQDKREDVEKEVKEKIKNKEINLESLAKEWHRESFKQAMGKTDFDSEEQIEGEDR